MGWITVGTQYSHSSIQEALEDKGAYRALKQPVEPDHEYSELEEQQGLVVRPGLSPQPHRVQTVVGGLDAPNPNQLELPRWGWFFRVGGDEQLKGPIYNYAKLFTWWQLASSVDGALYNTLDRVSNGRACSTTHQQSILQQHNIPYQQTTPQQQATPQWNSNIPARDNLIGDIRETASFAGLDTRPILGYPKWIDIPSDIHMSILAASAAALFLQWGTTGGSFLIAYLTPTVGLGCRSTSYLFYGSLGTISWLCLLGSMLISHEVMLRYQEIHVDNPSIDFRLYNNANSPNHYERSWPHWFLCGAAVILRITGKTVAVVNTIWLILSSLLEFVGAYDNCWCNSNYFGMRDQGWAVLFKGTEDLTAAARLPWGGGLAMTLIVCSVVSLVFFFGSLEDEKQRS